MQVDKIITTHDWIRDQQRIRTYRVLEDEVGNQVVRYEEQLYTPYNKRGNVVTAVEKGSLIDNMV